MVVNIGIAYTIFDKKNQDSTRSLMGQQLCSGMSLLCKHDVDGSEDVIWKCNLAFLQSFLIYSKSLCLGQNVF